MRLTHGPSKDRFVELLVENEHSTYRSLSNIVETVNDISIDALENIDGRQLTVSASGP